MPMSSWQFNLEFRHGQAQMEAITSALMPVGLSQLWSSAGSLH